MRQLLIFTETPFNERDYKRFGVDYFSNFFEVIICDCTAWLQKKFWNKYQHTAYQQGTYKIVNCYKQLLLVPIHQGDLVIDCLSNHIAVSLLRKKLLQHGVISIKLQNGLYPTVPRSNRLGKALKGFLFSPKKWLLHLKKLICSAIYTPPTLLIVSGETGRYTKDAIYAKFNLLAHSFDYDIYLQERRVPQGNNEKYIVFLDQDLAHHSDFYFDSMGFPVSEDTYYNELDTFFTIIEKKFAMKVIFAAHPRSDYSHRMHVLCGRPFYQNMTPQLVKNASLVLLHDTTSVSYAVLWYKPMVFLTTRALQQSMLGPSIQHVAKIFDLAPINITEESIENIETKDWLHVDKACYDRYKNAYIKIENSPDLSTQELLANLINREFGDIVE